MKPWKEILAWTVIGLSLGWLSSWSSNSVDAFRAIVLGLIAGTTGLVLMRATSTPSVSLRATAVLTFTFVIGVCIGESTLVMRLKWYDANLTNCELARASFSKTFTIPDGTTPCGTTAKQTIADTTQKAAGSTQQARESGRIP